MIFLIPLPSNHKEIADLALHELVQVDAASVHEFFLSTLRHLLFLLHHCGIIVGRIMPLFFVPVEYAKSTQLELLQIVNPHAITDHVKHAPYVRVLVIVLSDPSQSLINAHNEVVQVVVALRIIYGQLFLQFAPKKLALWLTE